MDTEANANFYGRAAIQWFAYLLRQADPDLDFSIDNTLICKSVTYRNSDGERESLRQWNCAPDAHRIRDARVTAARRFEKFASRACQFIPAVAGVSDGNNDEVVDNGRGKGRKRAAVQPEEDTTSKYVEEGGRQSKIQKVADSVRPRTRSLMVAHQADQSSSEYSDDGSTTGTSMDTATIDQSEGTGMEDEEVEGTDDGSAADGVEGTTGGHEMRGDGVVELEGWEMRGDGGVELEGWESAIDSEDSGGLGRVNKQSDDDSEEDETALTNGRATKRGPTGKISDVQSFRILEQLTTSRIEAEYTALVKEMEAYREHGDKGDGTYSDSDDIEILRTTFSLLENDPTSAQAPRIAKHVLEQALRCEMKIQRLHLRTRAERAQIILSASRLWRWVEMDMADLARSRLAETDAARAQRTRDWMDDIISVLQSGLADGRRLIELDPLRYPRMSAFATSSYTFTNRHAPLRYAGEDQREGLAEAVVDSIRLIIPHWMGFNGPDGKLDRNDRVRSWFINALEQIFGTKFLTTDLAWNWFTSFRTGWVIRGDRIYRTYTPSRHLMEPFMLALKRHPMLDTETEIGRCFATYSALISGECVPVPLYRISSSPYDKRHVHFVEFIRTGYRVVTGQQVAGAGGLGDGMLQSPDTLLPIRESLYARIRSRSAAGPYHSSFIKTRQGIFSALVWRGITDNTVFARVGRMQFTGVLDLQDAIDELALRFPAADTTYVCLQHIHGRYIGSRKTTNAITLWNDVGDLPKWEEFCDTFPTFGDCFTYFFGRAGDGEARRRVEDIDTVSMYNVVCDLVYAGICQPPTVDEMARYISTVKGQSYRAIRFLGLVDYTKDPTTEAAHALGTVQGLVMAMMSWEEIQMLGLDIIGLEYALGRYMEAKVRMESKMQW
jgi:hypothetical protein